MPPIEFFQYGLIDWEQFYSCLRTVIVSSDWAVFEYDGNTPGQHGTACPASDALVNPGTYILLRTGKYLMAKQYCSTIFTSTLADGNPITVEFTALAARPRHPNTPARVC